MALTEDIVKILPGVVPTLVGDRVLFLRALIVARTLITDERLATGDCDHPICAIQSYEYGLRHLWDLEIIDHAAHVAEVAALDALLRALNADVEAANRELS